MKPSAQNTLPPSLPPLYRNNSLIAALGPLLSGEEFATRLAHLPPRPDKETTNNPAWALHSLSLIDDIHLPCPSGQALASTVDLMIRTGYRYRNPSEPGTWSSWYADTPTIMSHNAPIIGSLGGVSGMGKTKSLTRALKLQSQTILHNNFPNLVGPLKSISWIIADVPASGQLSDLSLELMRLTDLLLGTDEFKNDLTKDRRAGMRLFDRWIHRVRRHFLGILVLEEIQNFFKIPSLKERLRSAKLPIHERPLLKVADDNTLKAILTLSNWGVPILFSGTPDGMQAFSSRMSIAQRLVGQGHLWLQPPETADDEFFKAFIDTLFIYQYLPIKLKFNADLRKKLFDMSGGVRRICIYLWRLGQRVAIENESKEFKFEHIQQALNTYLAPLKPAIAALRSDDPNKLKRYEDLLPPSDFFHLL